MSEIGSSMVRSHYQGKKSAFEEIYLENKQSYAERCINFLYYE